VVSPSPTTFSARVSKSVGGLAKKSKNATASSARAVGLAQRGRHLAAVLAPHGEVGEKDDDIRARAVEREPGNETPRRPGRRDAACGRVAPRRSCRASRRVPAACPALRLRLRPCRGRTPQPARTGSALPVAQNSCGRWTRSSAVPRQGRAAAPRERRGCADAQGSDEHRRRRGRGACGAVVLIGCRRLVGWMRRPRG
jgi:hypothetical protein